MTGYGSKRQMAADKVQEPVAWRWGIKKLNGGYEWRYALHKTQDDSVPLYAAPPKREWVGLTPEETSGFTQHEMTVVKYVSKVLQEKNT